MKIMNSIDLQRLDLHGLNGLVLLLLTLHRLTYLQ